MHVKSICRLFILILSFCVASSVFALSDSAITSSVKSKIAADSSLSGNTISVTTKDGVVMLSGKVSSDTQASEATEVAQSTEGVKDVDATKLTVNDSQQPFTDTLITAKVKGMFIQQKLFGDKDVAAMTIQVETNNGVVTLGGTADNQAQADNAVKIAKTVSGVKEVKSNIKISA